MHELSIALGILDVAAEHAQAHHANRVLKIHLRLGPLTGVVRNALESSFQIARQGTSLENAELVIEDVPLKGYCPACAAERTLASIQDLRCSVCGTETGHLLSGRELEITALEIT